MAKQYLHLITQQLSAVNSHNSKPTFISKNRECILWKTKKPTQLDHDATLAFLALRKQYNEEFSDKKTAKIVDKMNQMGFIVGDGVEGRETLLQKYANLTATYIKTIQKGICTGEGKISYSLYFEEMDDILGAKHKVTPHFVIDTATESTSSTEPLKSTNSHTMLAQKSTSKSSLCSLKVNQVNCFRSVKSSVKPQKQTAVETLEKIHKENMENRKNE